MADNAAAFLLGGQSASPRGIVPPAPDGVVLWSQFESTTESVALRNLRAPAAPLVKVGSPVFTTLHVACSTALGSLLSAITETGSMAFMAIFKVAVPGAGLAMICGDLHTSNGAGSLGLYVSAANSLTLGVKYTDSGTSNTAGALAGDWSTYKLICGVVEEGVGKRLYNLTDAPSAPTLYAKATARTVVPAAVFSLGAGAAGASTETHLAALSITRGRAPTTAEILANAAVMRARAALKGITV